MTKSAQLAQLAVSKLGTDFTPDWIVPDEVSCAFAVTTLLREFDPRIPIFHGTSLLYEYLRTSPLFEEVKQPIETMESGWIVISPTGYNSRPDIMPHGHVGIYKDATTIMSNSSFSGHWEENFTRDSWRKRYLFTGGYPIKIYKLKED